MPLAKGVSRAPRVGSAWGPPIPRKVLTNVAKSSDSPNPADTFRLASSLQILSALLSRQKREVLDDDVKISSIVESSIWIADRLASLLTSNTAGRIRSPSEISVTEAEELSGRDPLRLAHVLDEIYQAKMRSVLCSALLTKLNGLSSDAPEDHVRIPKEDLERLCELNWKNTKVLSELCGNAEFDLPKGTDDDLIV